MTTHVLTETMGETIVMSDFSPTLAAGDTVTISPSRTTAIKLYNIVGSPGSWITFVNLSGTKITISDSGTIGGALRIEGCRYIRLLSNDYGSETYGIRFTGTDAGLGIVNTRDIEVACIEIDNVPGVGIGYGQCWTPWTCTEEMENVTIHHNYIHDVGHEGMYFGKSSRAIAPKFRDIQIYNNRIENCGWDGLQLGQTIGDNNNVYNNTIKHCGYGGAYQYCWFTGQYQTEPCPGQWFGMIINPEHYGVNIYGNYIEDIYRHGIAIHYDADGPVYIHDNVVLGAGTAGEGNGIDVGSSIGISKIINNTVINSERYGIKTLSSDTTGECRYNLCVANGSGGVNSNYSIQNDNRTAANIATENFINAAVGNFRLTSASPARNAGIGLGYSTIDFDGNTRPEGSAADIGAFEFMEDTYPPYIRSRGSSILKPSYGMIGGRFR